MTSNRKQMLVGGYELAIKLAASSYDLINYYTATSVAPPAMGNVQGNAPPGR